MQLPLQVSEIGLSMFVRFTRPLLSGKRSFIVQLIEILWFHGFQVSWLYNIR